MDRPMSNLHFRIMKCCLRFRDFCKPPAKLLQEGGIKPGDRVLDFGCGPGSFSMAAAQLVGSQGRVYALDIHPLAVEAVKKAAAGKGLTNIETILSDCATGLEDSSIDTVILFDIYHGLGNPDRIMKELHRVMKPDSLLLFSDHHLKEEEILSRVAQSGLFALKQKGEKIIIFSKKT